MAAAKINEFGEGPAVMQTVEIADGADGEGLRVESDTIERGGRYDRRNRLGCIMEVDPARGRYRVNYTSGTNMTVWSAWFRPGELRHLTSRELGIG